MKPLLFFAIPFFLIKNSLAQTHNEEWAKYNFYAKLNTKFSASVDLNLRQQANYLSSDKNIFSLPLMRSTRLWLFYHLKKNFTIIGSAFIAKTSDVKNISGDLIRAKETQFDIGLLKKIAIKKLEIRNRFLLENRNINPENKSSINQLRYRLQNGLTISAKTFTANNKLKFLLLNEVFFKTQQSITGFDQNRTSCLLQWHYYHYEYNIGFQKTHQNQNANLISKNQLLLNLNYTL